MAKFTWLKSPNFPAWVSAIGTVAIAIVAFVTLDPVIENLELKQQNKKLKDELVEVQNQIHQATQSLELKKNETDSVKKSLDIAQQVLKSVKEQNDHLNLSSQKLLENLEAREEERSNLKIQIYKLNQEANSLQSENAASKAYNEKLKAQMVSIKNQLNKLEIELSKSKKNQRFYVVEAIVIKAKAKLPFPPQAHSSLKDKLNLILPFLFLTKSTGSYSNGRDIMNNLFSSREFDLLTDTDAQKLRSEITSFMDKKHKIFDESLILDSAIVDHWFKIISKKTNVILSVPDDLTWALGKVKNKSDIKKEKPIESSAEEQKAKQEYEREIERVKKASEQLGSALDELLKELS